MTKGPVLLALIVALTLISACTSDQAEPQGAETETLGAVTFPTSCKEDLAETFTRGIALLHSFEYPQARADFQAVADQDPACGIAHWGVAMTYLHPVWPSPMTPQRFTPGNIAAEKAETVGAPTDRERAYIATTSAFYGHGVERPHRERAQAWSDAMHELSEHFPDDTEAAIFYALSLLGTHDPTDSTLGHQKQAAALLNELFSAQPNHPGIAHYLIHSLDYPPLADQGLPAAQVYASIAPSSAHALHMPSHIFTRRGLWDESIATNIKSRDAARRLIARTMPDAVAIINNARDAEVHAQAYLAYAYLQIDDQARAKAVVGEAAQVTGFGYPLAAIPARWALERRDWEAAATVESLTDMPTDQLPYVRAITPFARALGAARTGRIDEARAEVERIHLLQLDLVESPIAGHFNWANNVESMRLAAAAWVAYAEEQTGEAVDLARSAANLDETTGKHPMTPGALLPARELLGDLLLALSRPTEALIEYERSLHEAPNRFNSLYGAARSAELSGSLEKAKEYYDKLVEMTIDESTRTEVEHARAFLKAHED